MRLKSAFGSRLRALAIGGALAFAATWSTPAAQAPAPTSPRTPSATHVVLISIDGFKPDY